MWGTQFQRVRVQDHSCGRMEQGRAERAQAWGNTQREIVTEERELGLEVPPSPPPNPYHLGTQYSNKGLSLPCYSDHT